MTFCFFSLFSDFWSTAILHISSGPKNASWLFAKRRGKKEMQKQQQEPREEEFICVCVGGIFEDW